LSWRVPGELQHLRALLDPIGVMLVARCPTSIGLLHIVRLRSVLIPRLVTWRGVREILVFIDLPTLSR
jgi:hypothetical protein